MAVVMAGFVDFEITWREDVFAGAPQEGSAANFGTVGINFRARKPINEAEWLAALAALNCEVPENIGPKMAFEANAFYDAGDQGCGYGPITDIAALLRDMDSGQTLEIRATDLSVKVDLPAWCRMTGHQLISQRDDRYLLQKK